MRIDLKMDYERVLAGKAEAVHLALVFKAEKQDSSRTKPIAFGLVLDNSGSMAGQPLAYAKSAASLVVQHLRSDDQFALVIFSSSARTIIPLQRPADKSLLQKRIAALSDEGSTNLTAGWMLGRDELSKAPADLPRKLLLLTDGHLNAGIVEPAHVQQIVAGGLEKERIRTSCLGFGDGYNEDLLDELAKVSAGALHDAASPEMLPGIFQKELESLLSLSAQNVRVRIRKLHYCSGVTLLNEYPTVALPEGGLEVMVGDLVSEEERVLVLSLEALPLPPLPESLGTATLEGEALLDLEFVYDEITPEGISSKVEQRTIRLAATQDAAEVKVNEQVIQWVAEQKAARTISEAIEHLDAGDIEAFHAKVSATVQDLEAYGDSANESVSSLSVFEEMGDSWDARSRKEARSYSSRALRKSSFYTTEQPPEPEAPKAPEPPPGEPPTSEEPKEGTP